MGYTMKTVGTAVEAAWAAYDRAGRRLDEASASGIVQEYDSAWAAYVAAGAAVRAVEAVARAADDGCYCRGCGVLMHAAREMVEAAEHISASLVCPECGYGHLLTCQYAQVGTYFDTGEGRYEPAFTVQG